MMLRGRSTRKSNNDQELAVSKRVPRGLATRSSNNMTDKLKAVEIKAHHVRRETFRDQKNLNKAAKPAKESQQGCLNKAAKPAKEVLQTKEVAKKQRDAETLKLEQEQDAVTGSRFDDVEVHCEVYADDVYKYMFHVETKFGVKQHFLADRTVTPMMRSVLVDWLIQVHLRFHLLPETLFATLNLLDRYLSVGVVDKRNLQLVGVTCMSIASKYEEMYAPELQDYVYITEDAYSKRDIIRMEIEVLEKVGVDLGRPHVIQFLRRISCYFDAVLHAMAKYICENAVIDYATCHLKPSLIAAVSLWLASRLGERHFPDALYRMARVSPEELREWEGVFAAGLLRTNNSTKLSALRSKYASAKNSHVGDLLPKQLAILQHISCSPTR